MTSNTHTAETLKAGVVYGSLVYWGTFIGAGIVLVGSIMAMLAGRSQVPLVQQYEILLQGGELGDYAVKSLGYYVQGDGIALIGIVFAFMTIVPAIGATVPMLWRSGSKTIAVCGVANAALILGAAIYAIV